MMSSTKRQIKCNNFFLLMSLFYKWRILSVTSYLLVLLYFIFIETNRFSYF